MAHEHTPLITQKRTARRRIRLHFAASSRDTDMRYLVGATIPDPFFYLDTGHEKIVFLNDIEIGHYRETHPNTDIEVKSIAPYHERGSKIKTAADISFFSRTALAILRSHDMDQKGEPIYVSDHFPLLLADELRSFGITLNVMETYMPERMLKTAEEIAHIRKGMQHTCEAFRRIEHILRLAQIVDDTLMWNNEPLTCEILKREVSILLAGHFMSNPENMIISCGTQASMPHHLGIGIIRPHQTIICDLFPRSDTTGYFADMTRTYVKGTPTAKVRKMYDAVRAAQDAAFVLIKPDEDISKLDEAAIHTFANAGFARGRQGYVHGLGHGVGLDLHEAPSVYLSVPGILVPGFVFTVEPGLYYTKHGGVRLEDVVVVTKDGYENLTNYPRELVIP